MSAPERARLVPLGVFFLIDQSGSLAAPSGAPGLEAPKTRWRALANAVTAFVQHASPSDYSVGVQYFPYVDASVPDSCETSAECGKYGPCGGRAVCIRYGLPGQTPLPPFGAGDHGSNGGLRACTSNADCTVPGETGHCWDVGYCDGHACFTPTDCLKNEECIFEKSCLAADSCIADDYTQPAVPISALPEGGAAVVGSLFERYPWGETPMAAALDGSLKVTRDWASAHPEQAAVVLLVTDGRPAACGASDISGVVDVAAIGASATPRVVTFAVGQKTVGEPDDDLTAVAVAGGTEKALLVEAKKSTTTQLLDAFEVGRRATLGCEYRLPVSLGEATAYSMINAVVVSDAQGTETPVSYVSGDADCDPVAGGWHYDLPPKAAAPHKIQLCPASCVQIEADKTGWLRLDLGCPTL